MVEQVRLFPREIQEADFPIARFLSANEQARYKEECAKYGERARKSLDVNSNLFKILLLNQIGIQTATLPELETALENGLDLRGNYEDSREAILRSAGDSYKPNDFLAKDLSRKLKIKGSIKVPLIITHLKPVKDENSEYGLILEPTDRTQIIKAPDFDNRNNQRKFRKVNPDYSVEFDDAGDRTLYTKKDGLSGLSLDGNLSLNSDWNDLADSNGGGRVVVVSGEATSQKFISEYLGKLREQENNQIAEIKIRREKAERYLRTGKLE